MTNEQRAEQLIQKYGFTFSEIPKQEIQDLLKDEIAHFQEGSAEYIRLLCGYLYCIGDSSDADLIEKAKYGIDMDVGCMIDGEWIDSLKGIENEFVGSREEIMKYFVTYYQNYFTEDEI